MGQGLKSVLLIISIFCFGVIAYGQEKTAVGLYNEAKEKFDAKEYDTALELFEQALAKVDPESDSESEKKVVKFAKYYSGGAKYYIGNGLRKAEKYDEALAAYEKGIEYSKSFYSNYVGRAQCYEKMGNDTAAVKAYILAADMTRKAKKEERADKLLSKAENFAAIAKSKKQWDKTIATAQAFLAEKESANAHYYLAEGLKGKKKNAEALEHISKAIEMESGDKNKLIFSKAEILEGLGQKSKAVEAYKMVNGDKYGERAKYKATQLEGSK